MRYALIVALLSCLAAPSLWAAGGTCPTAAQYTNPANPLGPQVSLFTLGITSCYFISAAGADTNNGTSEATPFLHSPGMANCSNTCAGVTLNTAGIGYIFRGGDTWHFGNSGLSPYAGIVSACSSNGTHNGAMCLASIHGTAANPIYFGVDQSWFSGGSWVRPVLTGDNPLTPNPKVFADFVASCSFQLGNQNNITDFSNSSFVIFDNFELMGLCQNDVNNTKQDGYFILNAADNMVITNNYSHGWTHTKFNVNGDCGATGTRTSVCMNMQLMAGDPSTPANGPVCIRNVFDGSDSDPAGAQLGANVYNWSLNVVRYYGGWSYKNLHAVHDNLWEHVYSPGDLNAHGNVFQSNSEFQGTDVFYNNRIDNVCTDSGACPNSVSGLIFQNAPVGFTEYIFNNVYFNTQSVEFIGLGGTNPSGQGTKTFFNNTLQTNSGGGVGILYGCAGTHTWAYSVANDMNIIDSLVSVAANCTSQQTAPPLTEQTYTNAGVPSGYSQAETFAYSPPNATGPTVGAGTNNQAVCTTLLGNADPLIQQAGTACQSDTSYGAAYNASTHTVTGVGRATTPRPTSAPWDIGAYQFSNTQLPTAPAVYVF